MQSETLAVVALAALIAASSAVGQTTARDCPPGVVWGQELASAATLDIWWSDTAAEVHIIENLDGFNGTITDLHWWGVETNADQDPCERTGGDFDIVFYNSAEDGLPDDVEEQFNSLSVERTVTGLTHDGFDVVSYSAELPVSVTLNNGWLSIIGVESNDCYFQWATSNQGDELALYHSLRDNSLAQDNANYAICVTGERASGGEGEGEGEGEVITIQCPGGTSVDIPISKNQAGEWISMALAAAVMLAAGRFKGQ